MTEPHSIWHDVDRFIREHSPHPHYHATSAPPTTETPMTSILHTLEADAEELLSHAQDFVRNHVPNALADAKKLEGIITPGLADALSAVTHVPPQEIEALIVPSLNWLASRWIKPAESLPPVADPQPEPVPAP
jgi:hypothetical protein